MKQKPLDEYDEINVDWSVVHKGAPIYDKDGRALMFDSRAKARAACTCRGETARRVKITVTQR